MGVSSPRGVATATQTSIVVYGLASRATGSQKTLASGTSASVAAMALITISFKDIWRGAKGRDWVSEENPIAQEESEPRSRMGSALAPLCLGLGALPAV